MKYARAALPGMPDYKLNTLCEQLHLGLNHHNADSDAHAAAEILLMCMQRADVSDFIRTAKMTVLPKAVK